MDNNRINKDPVIRAKIKAVNQWTGDIYIYNNNNNTKFK